MFNDIPSRKTLQSFVSASKSDTPALWSRSVLLSQLLECFFQERNATYAIAQHGGHGLSSSSQEMAKEALAGYNAASANMIRAQRIQDDIGQFFIRADEILFEHFPANPQLESARYIASVSSRFYKDHCRKRDEHSFNKVSSLFNVNPFTTLQVAAELLFHLNRKNQDFFSIVLRNRPELEPLPHLPLFRAGTRNAFPAMQENYMHSHLKLEQAIKSLYDLSHSIRSVVLNGHLKDTSLPIGDKVVLGILNKLTEPYRIEFTPGYGASETRASADIIRLGKIRRDPLKLGLPAPADA